MAGTAVFGLTETYVMNSKLRAKVKSTEEGAKHNKDDLDSVKGLRKFSHKRLIKSGQKLEAKVDKLEAKIDKLGAKLEAKVDQLAADFAASQVILQRMDAWMDAQGFPPGPPAPSPPPAPPSKSCVSMPCSL